MLIIHAIILGIVEGLTEFLPISSTGHLIITSHLLSIPTTDFLKSFEIIIQVGAIAAVVVLYFKKILASRDLWKKVFAGFIPTAIIGYGMYKIVKLFLIGNIVVVAWSLLLGGIFLVCFERWYGKRKRHGKSMEDMTYREAIIIGCIQALAVIPGISRSAATIVGGLTQNISREAIVEFSFLLAVPVIGAAAFLDIIKTPINFTRNEWGLLAVGLITSFIVAVLAIKFFLSFVKSHTFEWFGYYRIVLGIAVLAGVYFLG
ncbi:MAG: undecaprenyl-diphosphatase UppP [bacterium]